MELAGNQHTGQGLLHHLLRHDHAERRSPNLVTRLRRGDRVRRVLCCVVLAERLNYTAVDSAHSTIRRHGQSSESGKAKAFDEENLAHETGDSSANSP